MQIICTHSSEVCVPGPTLFYFSWDREKCYRWCTFISEFVTASNPFLILSPSQVVNSISIYIGMNNGHDCATFLLFGLSEIGNITLHFPNNPNLEGAVGNHNMTYVVVFPLPICSPLLNFPAMSRVLSRSSMHCYVQPWMVVSRDDTLGTVLFLCETLLSFLPSGMYRDQPTRLLRAYDVVPMSKLSCSHRLTFVPLRRSNQACCTHQGQQGSVGATG